MPSDIKPLPMFAPYLYIDTGYAKHAKVHDAFTLAFVTGFANGKAVWDAGTEPDPAVCKGLKRCIVSFGGAGSTSNELAGKITDVHKLADAYASVAARFGSTELDFDVEGASLSHKDAIDRRNAALALVGPKIKVNYTLPVMPSGLDSQGLYVLKSAIAAKVKVHIVNIMAMDYGIGCKDCGAAAIKAAKATRAQLDTLGMRDTLVGITPMIGANDTPPECFTLDNARALKAFVTATPWVGLVSMWNVNRDNGTKVDSHANDARSGVVQTEYQFTSIFKN